MVLLLIEDSVLCSSMQFSHSGEMKSNYLYPATGSEAGRIDEPVPEANPIKLIRQSETE
jgi:hypothetical protein